MPVVRRESKKNSSVSPQWPLSVSENERLIQSLQADQGSYIGFPNKREVESVAFQGNTTGTTSDFTDIKGQG